MTDPHKEAGYRNFPGHSMCCRCVSCENANRNRDAWFPGDPVTSDHRTPDPLLEEAVGLLRRLLASEADAQANPTGGLSLGGLMDSRDNNGCVYQSADLEDILTRSSDLISRMEADRKGAADA